MGTVSCDHTPHTMASTKSLDALPAELLLSIIPHISYTPANLTSLRLVSRKMNALVTAHEQGLVTDIKTQQYSPATLTLFPSLPHSYEGLHTMHSRNQTLDDLHKHWLHVTNHGPDLGWMRDRWETIHKAGMLLLYRLYDAGNPSSSSSPSPYRDNTLADPTDSQRDLINLLPATSLACLVFKLYSSIKILRIYGPEPICASYAKDFAETRCDIELAFEEMLLRHGPDFFVIMLQAGRAADSKRKQWAIESVTPPIPKPLCTR